MRNALMPVLAAAVASTAVMLVPDHTSEAQAQYTMAFGTTAPDGTPWSDQLVDLKKRIEKDSGGRIAVKMFLGSSLGSEVEMVEELAGGRGRIQAGGFSTAAVGQALDLPILELPELPFLFNTTAEADAILDDVLYAPVDAALKTKGVVLYTWAENGWRSFATKGETGVRTPADLAAYKMRSQESDVHLNMYEALGVQAVKKPVAEVLPALKTGIVSGFDNTPLFSLAAGWINAASHYTLSKHIYQPAAIVYGKSFYDGLPEDLQTLVMANRKQEAGRGRTGVRALEAQLLSAISESGVEVIELNKEERGAFRKACRKEVHAKFLAQHPALQDEYGAVKTKLQTMRGK
ncbi:MAG: C4-dicarboxylate ABC transporter substrate-binding protein [Deltaproteobacteria bacterium]|nr:C4-dicarboxylate ABC transporter substrate-binding protein [Deltaproteobacteria bacterium]HCH63430.1 C4-dicarboxylate ABC transporter substrate-binding protein [Deltaproteobacteria bacterium]